MDIGSVLAAPSIARTQGIEAVSAGGVILPGVTAPGGGAEGAGGWTLGEHVYPPGTETKKAVSPTLEERSEAYLTKPGNMLYAYIPTGPEPFKGIHSFVIPLLAQVGDIVEQCEVVVPGFVQLVQDWLSPSNLSTPQIRVGFSTTAPTTSPREPTRWWEFENAGQEEFANEYISTVHFDVSYLLPVTWVLSPRNYDALRVGVGNYAPKPNHFPFGLTEGLYKLTEKERKTIEEWLAAFAAMSPGEKATVEAEEKATHEANLALDTARRLRFSQANGYFRELDVVHESQKELEKAKKEKEEKEGPLSPEELEAYEKAQAKLLAREIELDAKLHKLAEEKVGQPREQEQAERQARGPFMNGVKDWAWRVSTKNPGGGLPDLTKTKGYLIIAWELGLGQRWIESHAFDWPGKLNSLYGIYGQFFGASPRIAGTLTAGAHGLARVAS